MMLEDSRGQFHKELTALDGGRLPPDSLVCVAGRQNAGVDVFTCAARDGRELLPVARIDNRICRLARWRARTRLQQRS